MWSFSINDQKCLADNSFVKTLSFCLQGDLIGWQWIGGIAKQEFFSMDKTGLKNRVFVRVNLK